MTAWLPLAAAAVLIAVLIRARCPLAALVVRVAAGGAYQNHLVELPQAVAAPIATYTRQLHVWQRRDAAALSCDVAQTNAVRTDSA